MAAIISNGIGGGIWSAGASWTGGVAPAEGDTCQIQNGDTITLDSTVIVGADSTTPAIDVLTGGTLAWDNGGSDTLTLKGDLYIRNGGTVNFDGRTTLANVLTIKLNYSASLANNKYICKMDAGATLICNGYNKERAYDIIASNANSGQANVVTTSDNSSKWSINDDVVVTQTAQYAASQDETKIISSFSGATITLTTNLANNHLATYGYVANLTRNIIWTTYNTSYTSYISGVTAPVTIDLNWTRLTYLGRTGSYSIVPANGSNNLNLDYCVIDNTNQYALVMTGKLASSLDWKGNIFYKCGGWLFAANDITFQYNMTIECGLSGGGGTNNYVHHNIWVKCSGGSCYYAWGTLIGVYFYNNKIVGCNNGFTVGESSIFKGLWYDNEVYGTTTACLIKNATDHKIYNNILGDTTLPVTTAYSVGGYNVYCFVYDNTGSWTTTVAASSFTAGSIVGFTNDNGTNIDYSVKDYGYIYRTGTGLVDTTVRTAGGFAVRFQSTSSTSQLTWEQSIPTGNIQNKSMTVYVWCKINSANYYSGTYQLPRLTIDYDNGTTVYAEATASTDWQLLSVTFTPTTTFGQVTATLSTMTDQTTTNSYVYFDDYGVLYPAGVQLNLGSLDIWANGLPVMPTIATNLSAQDVWSAQDMVDYGTGTIGNRIKKLKNPSLIVDGEIIL